MRLSIARTYPNAIVEQAEERLNLCVPGGKETARMLKKLVEEMGGGATGPDERAAKAERRGPQRVVAAIRATAPVEARFVSRGAAQRRGRRRRAPITSRSISRAGLDYKAGEASASSEERSGAGRAVIAAIDAPADFPIAGKTLRDVLTEDMSLGARAGHAVPAHLLHDRRRASAKAKALATARIPDGDAATLDVLAAVRNFRGMRPDPEAFVEALEPLQPRLYSISSSSRRIRAA